MQHATPGCASGLLFCFSPRLFTTAKKGLRRHLHGLRQQEWARPGGRPLPGLVCSSGTGPSQRAFAGGSSSKEAASARWAATARRPDQRATQAVIAAGLGRWRPCAWRAGAGAAPPQSQTGHRPQRQQRQGGSVGLGRALGTSDAVCAARQRLGRSRGRHRRGGGRRRTV